MSDHAKTPLLRIGVPSKGRLAEISAQLLNDAGVSFRRNERSLFALCRGMPVEVIFLRTDDIPVLTAEGAIDLGITGADLVAESGEKLVHRLDLGIGSCRLALCVADDSPVTDARQLAGKRVATSFPRITRQWLAERGVEAHFVELSGSVEIMINLGVADAIVDRIVRRLEGIVIARNWSLLEYNVPRTRLAEAEKITPGFNSPTVSGLEDPDWCAVRSMVKRGEAHAIMERLDAIGASAIIETQIANCRL